MKLSPAFPIAIALFAATMTHSRAADLPGEEEVRQAMAKATSFLQDISREGEGGYLWRYATDLSVVAGESKAARTQIWIQPPGTPAVGQAFLRAHATGGDAVHLEAALAAAHALARGQLESGGWSYSIDFAPDRFEKSLRRTDRDKVSPDDAAKRDNSTTFDDNTSQAALRFLMATVEAIGEPADEREREIVAAMEYGLEKLIEAQYPNGAWPQRYNGKPHDPAAFPILAATIPEDWAREQPERHNYSAFYTFNDHSISDCIATLLDAHRRFGRPEHLAAAEKGGEFILLSQLPEPQPAWAQQYNAKMEPDWARSFEPPTVSSAESVGAMESLLELHLATGDEKYLHPIPAALAWLERSPIRPGVWARYYELGTNKPIYGDRDGKIYYRLEDISKERQSGYAWERDFGVPRLTQRFEEIRTKGREAVLERRQPREYSEKEKESRRRSLAKSVKKTLEDLDDKGRWVTKKPLQTRGMEFGERIETSEFIRNLNLLSQYLEFVGEKP